MTSITQTFQRDIDNDGKLDTIEAKFTNTGKEASLSATIIYADGTKETVAPIAASLAEDLGALKLGDEHELTVVYNQLEIN